MQENIALNPGVRAIEIEAVVVAAGDDIVNELHDRLPWPVASCEIHHIMVTARFAEEVAQKDSVAVAPDTARAVARLELGGGGRKIAVADDEGSLVHVDIRRASVPEGQVIEIDRAGIYFNTRRAGVVGVELELRPGDARLRRSHGAVDGNIAPVSGGSGREREENRRVQRAFSEQAAAVGHGHPLPCVETNESAGLDRQGHATLDRDGIGHDIMHVRIPDRVGGDGPAHKHPRGLARAAGDIGVSGFPRTVRRFDAIIVFLSQDGVAVRVVGNVGTDRRQSLPGRRVG